MQNVPLSQVKTMFDLTAEFQKHLQLTPEMSDWLSQKTWRSDTAKCRATEETVSVIRA